MPKVAAIINWYGITDVNDMLSGPNARAYAVQWLGSPPNREAIAKSVSPLTYVRADLPPILSIQGDADPIVPYSQNVRLQRCAEEGRAQRASCSRFRRAATATSSRTSAPRHTRRSASS